MSTRLTWDQIQQKYPDRWVGLVDIVWKDNSNVESAIVKYDDKSCNDLLALQFSNEPELFGCYTTPDHVAHVGVVG